MRTIVINLFGGPGIGKSTTAAELFVWFKKHGILCELIQEYVKGWAWEGRKVGPFDQVYILAKQLKLESRLYGKVNVLITDSPLLFSPIYERLYQHTAASEPMAMTILETARKHDVEHVNFLLTRAKPYVKEGRYETEIEAKQVDSWIRTFLDFHKIPYLQPAANDAVEFITGDVVGRLHPRDQMLLIPAPEQVGKVQ